VAYFFFPVNGGNVILSDPSPELLPSLTVDWIYKEDENDEEHNPAPYWPQNHDCREYCLSHGAVPATPLPRGIVLTVADWFATAGDLPGQFETPVAPLVFYETFRGPNLLTLECDDEWGQSWIWSISLEAEYRSAPIDRSKWKQAAFPIESDITVRRTGGDEIKLVRWNGALSGIVDYQDTLPRICVFWRQEPVPPMRKWGVSLELFVEPFTTPCNAEGLAPFLFLQTSGSEVVVNDWVKYARQFGGQCRGIVADDEGATWFSRWLSRISVPSREWVTVRRAICLDERQFTGQAYEVGWNVRLTNTLPTIITGQQVPPAPSMTPWGLGPGVDYLAALSLNDWWARIRPVSQFGANIFFNIEGPNNPNLATMIGQAINGGQLVFKLIAQIRRSIPPQIPTLWRVDYYLDHFGQRTFLQARSHTVAIPFGIGNAPLDEFVADWEGQNTNVNYDPQTGLVLYADYPTAEITPLTPVAIS
jgi:hypothetical protein